jgi:hypothetical protein
VLHLEAGLRGLLQSHSTPGENLPVDLSATRTLQSLLWSRGVTYFHKPFKLSQRFIALKPFA